MDLGFGVYGAERERERERASERASETREERREGEIERGREKNRREKNPARQWGALYQELLVPALPGCQQISR